MIKIIEGTSTKITLFRNNKEIEYKLVLIKKKNKFTENPIYRYGFLGEDGSFFFEAYGGSPRGVVVPLNCIFPLIPEGVELIETDFQKILKKISKK